MIAPDLDDEMDINDLYIAKFDGDIAKYIGGFVVRRITPELKCSECIDLLKAKQKPVEASLTSLKDNGGLIYVNEQISKLFTIAEKQMQISLTLKNALADNFFVERNCVKITKSAIELIPDLGTSFDDHFSSTLKKLVITYIGVRCRHFKKNSNIEMKKCHIRQKLTKTVLFKHL